MLNADSLFVPDERPKKEEEKDGTKLDELLISNLVGEVNKRFVIAAQARSAHEDRMMNAYNNFRGIYGKNVSFRRNEKSKVFVKATKTKVLAGYGQIVDIIFGGTKFPIGISPTVIPEGIDSIAHVSPEMAKTQEPTVGLNLKYEVGYAGDGKELPAGATFGSKLKEILGVGKKDKDKYVQPGAGKDPAAIKFRPADEAAYKMDKLIQDQLDESDSITQLSNAIFEAVLLGTGVIKGPFTYVKTLHKWELDEVTGKRKYIPINTKVPRIEFVSVWDIYPDPNATCKEEMSYFIHRHRLNASQMLGLIKMPQFKEDQINLCLESGPSYTKQPHENVIGSSLEEGSGRDYSDRFEVLEYWGIMSKKFVEEHNLPIPEEAQNLKDLHINVWVCQGKVLRIVLNPFTPTRIPYHIFNYERNPYSIFGVGIPENMSDSQAMMNGHARMAVDNLALAGGLVFDVDETSLVPGQDMEVYNGKIFYRQAGSPGQAVFGIKFPNTAQENMMMFDKFRQLADEETGLPSYSHGQTGIQSTGRTAAGMSMLLGAAGLNTKTVIKNLDQQVLKPLGVDLFHWNMQYYEGDLDISGDLEVKALATSSLMQKEVRSQRLNLFLQTAMNQLIAPFVNIPYIVEELAVSLDLDKDKILSSTEEARAYAQIIGLQNLGKQTSETTSPLSQESTSLGTPTGVGKPADGLGTTGNGNGNIGTGVTPMPGETEYSANA